MLLWRTNKSGPNCTHSAPHLPFQIPVPVRSAQTMVCLCVWAPNWPLGAGLRSQKSQRAKEQKVRARSERGCSVGPALCGACATLRRLRWRPCLCLCFSLRLRLGRAPLAGPRSGRILAAPTSRPVGEEQAAPSGGAIVARKQAGGLVVVVVNVWRSLTDWRPK